MHSRHYFYRFRSIFILILALSLMSCASTSKKYTNLQQAVIDNDLVKVKEELAKESSEKEKDKALAMAAYRDKNEIFQEILKSGVSDEPWIALKHSVNKCDYEKVSKIVDTGIRWNPEDWDIKRISHGAIKCRDSNIAKLLIDLDKQNPYYSMKAYLSNASNKLRSVWPESEVYNAYEVNKFEGGYVLKGPEDSILRPKTLLHIAIDEKNFEVIRVMLEAGVSPEVLNYRSIIKSKIIDYRIPVTGVNLDKGWVIVYAKEKRGIYPSPCAPVNSNYSTYFCNPTPREREQYRSQLQFGGSSLMFYDQVGGDLGYVLDYGMKTAFLHYTTPEPRIESEDMTPLMYATYLGYTPIVKMLINFGADVNAINTLGKTAKDYAKESNRTDLLSLF